MLYKSKELVSGSWRWPRWDLHPAGGPAASERPVDLVVIYPEVREPFARVFEEVVRGAEEGYQQEIRRVSMADNQSPVDFVHVLDESSPVLVLGNRLARQVTEHNADRRLIVGAVNSQYSDVFGITLIPDSGLSPETAGTGAGC